MCFLNLSLLGKCFCLHGQRCISALLTPQAVFTFTGLCKLYVLEPLSEGTMLSPPPAGTQLQNAKRGGSSFGTRVSANGKQFIGRLSLCSDFVADKWTGSFVSLNKWALNQYVPRYGLDRLKYLHFSFCQHTLRGGRWFCRCSQSLWVELKRELGCSLLRMPWAGYPTGILRLH